MEWSVEYADSVVGLLFGLAKSLIVGLAVYSLSLLVLWNQDRTIKLRKHVSCASLVLTLSVGLLGIYVTYSIFRNQAQQNSEFALNNHGTNFVNWERSNENIACLYVWHAFDDPEECRHELTKDKKSYREVMLYIEEALFLLESAQGDRVKWGARYAEDVRYWAEDVSEDPTGLFAYNIVVENDDPKAAVLRAGLSITDQELCNGFSLVVGDLARNESAQIAEEIARDPINYCWQKLATQSE